MSWLTLYPRRVVIVLYVCVCKQQFATVAVSLRAVAWKHRNRPGYYRSDVQGFMSGWDAELLRPRE